MSYEQKIKYVRKITKILLNLAKQGKIDEKTAITVQEELLEMIRG